MEEFSMGLLLVQDPLLFCLVKLNLIDGFMRHKETPQMRLKTNLDSLTEFCITHSDIIES